MAAARGPLEKTERAASPSSSTSPVPDANEEYLLYQTLVGAWPLEPYSEADYADFVARIQAYMVKALHEAKVHSSWINPNAAYDEAVTEFVARILDEQQNREFLEDFQPFQRRISHLGLLNSLASDAVEDRRRPARRTFTRGRSSGTSASSIPTTAGPWTSIAAAGCWRV